MGTQHLGIEEARGRLGELVTAAQRGEDVILTRRGRPVVRLTRYQEDTMVTGVQVVQQMQRHLDGRSGREPFDLIDQSRRAAAVLLGEREYDLREATQLRVIEASLAGIATLCEALDVDPDSIDEQPAELATIGQARTVMASIVDA